MDFASGIDCNAQLIYYALEIPQTCCHNVLSEFHVLFNYRLSGISILDQSSEKSRKVDVPFPDDRENLVFDGRFKVQRFFSVPLQELSNCNP